MQEWLWVAVLVSHWLAVSTHSHEGEHHGCAERKQASVSLLFHTYIQSKYLSYLSCMCAKKDGKLSAEAAAQCFMVKCGRCGKVEKVSAARWHALLFDIGLHSFQIKALLYFKDYFGSVPKRGTICLLLHSQLDSCGSLLDRVLRNLTQRPFWIFRTGKRNNKLYEPYFKQRRESGVLSKKKQTLFCKSAY